MLGESFREEIRLNTQLKIKHKKNVDTNKEKLTKPQQYS